MFVQSFLCLVEYKEVSRVVSYIVCEISTVFAFSLLYAFGFLNLKVAQLKRVCRVSVFFDVVCLGLWRTRELCACSKVFSIPVFVAGRE